MEQGRRYKIIVKGGTKIQCAFYYYCYIIEGGVKKLFKKSKTEMGNDVFPEKAKVCLLPSEFKSAFAPDGTRTSNLKLLCISLFDYIVWPNIEGTVRFSQRNFFGLLCY